MPNTEKVKAASRTYHAIGLMSGSSLDGLDMAYCRIIVCGDKDNFRVDKWQILIAETAPFNDEWQKILRLLPQANAYQIMQSHADFGHYMASLVNSFIQKNGLEVDFIASHGHTIFHSPQTGFTTQIGDGAALAVKTNCKVISDFRSADVAAGGQGAPFAPMADKYLFYNFDFFLNIGGIANISAHLPNGQYIAYDNCGANQALNFLAKQIGKEYDEGGAMARLGTIDLTLLKQLNSLDYLSLPYPKSLSNEWVQKQMIPLITADKVNIYDKLCTVCEHIAMQISKDISLVITNEGLSKEKYSLLATGGGVFNDFLMSRLKSHCMEVAIVIPDKLTVQFKEAALMALLGVMRLENIPNSMPSVTGARQSTVGGAIYG